MAGGNARPAQGSPAVTVVIPTGGEPALAEHCIQALASTEALPLGEVVVVDSIALAKGPHLGAFVLLLSPHAVPSVGFLEALITHYRAHEHLPRPLAVSPRSRGTLAWLGIPSDWGPLVDSPLPPQAVLVSTADWEVLAARLPPRTLAADAPAGLAFAAATFIETDGLLTSNRPMAIASVIGALMPRWTPTDTPGLLLQASQANLSVGIPATSAWLHLAACDMPRASTALGEWRTTRATLPERERDALPRLIRRRDQLAAEVLQEARLAPSAAEIACRAIAEGDWRRAVDNRAANPGSYPAAVAVVALAASECRPRRPAPDAIPPVLVQGWFDSPMPQDALTLVETWTRHHPAWEHRIFDTETASDWIRQWLGPEAARTFLTATPVGKANLFRYAYLSVVGGVWSDTDDRCIACIDPLLDRHTLVIWRESIGAIGDNFIAAAPGHPVLVATADEAFRNVRDGFGESPWLANGPGVFTRHVAAWLATDGPDLDYRIASGYELSEYIAIHQPLEYKETSLAWDVPANPSVELPSYWSHPWDQPQPLSSRQRLLLGQAAGA